MSKRRRPSQEIERLRRRGLTPTPEQATAGYAELARHMRIVGALAIGSFIGWALTHAVYMAILAGGYAGAVVINVPELVFAMRHVHRYQQLDLVPRSVTIGTATANVTTAGLARVVRSFR